MFGIIHTYRLGIGFRLGCFRFRLTDSRMQGGNSHQCAHQAAAEDDIQDFVQFHAARHTVVFID